MEGDTQRLGTSASRDEETARQFRVLDQTLSMHTFLRDRYACRALSLDVVLLFTAVIFCTTRFVGDDFFVKIGVAANTGKFAVGVAATLAFFASIVTLRVDWKGKSARHGEAVQKLTNLTSLFRKLRLQDGTWPPDKRDELHRAYWEAMGGIVQVPAAQFLNLKARHLRKVETSKMLDSAPACPIFVLRLILLKRSLQKTCSGSKGSGKDVTDGSTRRPTARATPTKTSAAN